MTALTDSLDLVTQALINKIVTAATAQTIKSTAADTAGNVAMLQPGDVYYGDQVKYPRTPSVAVEPGDLQRVLQGVSFRTDNNFTAYILCYHSQLQDNQNTRKQIEQVAENIIALIHTDPQLGGLLIHNFCETNDSGYVYRQGTLYRTNRITWSGYSKTALR